MKIVISFVIIVVIVMIGLNLMRNVDELRTYLTWQKLETLPVKENRVFSPDMVVDLPAPAKRYFEYSIKSGTPLKKVVRIEMNGRLGLGPKKAPDYMDMTANQIMAFPVGFIWNVKTGRGPMVMTGSDGFYEKQSWSRFWLMHALPVGRAGGLSDRAPDHRRAAFGRLVAETVFWSPAALLAENVSWEEIDSNSARATITYQDLSQTVDIFVNEHGQATKVIIPRWTDANADNTYRMQPFGGYLSAYKEYEGYRLPTHVEGGNFIGTDQYFPFYIADVKTVTYMD